MRLLRELGVAALGGVAYYLIECLWRGWSHWTMFLLGGLCFWLIGRLDRRGRAPVAVQACLGAMIVTVLELIMGLIVNRWLGWNVWDYSWLPMNFMGQVCLYYFVLWIPLSAAAIFLEDALRHWLFGEPWPHYTMLPEAQ